MLSARNGYSSPQALNQGGVTVDTQALQQRFATYPHAKSISSQSVGSEETVAALPTSVTGDFYSPEALRRRLPVESVVPKSVPGDASAPDNLIVALPSASSAKLVEVKQPPLFIRQSLTEAEWAKWAAFHGVRATPPVKVV